MDVRDQPLVSMITPVYNGESYLVECIESVLAQTYQNWEYIIVDNCSTDGTREIAESYARKDERIRVYGNTDFVGVIQNHNIAFRQISDESKYCKIVQADDWIFPECVEQMVRLAEEHPVVGIVSAYRLDEDVVGLDGLPYVGNVVPGRDVCRKFLIEGPPGVFGSPTSTLVRSSLVRRTDPFYNEDNLHADTEMCYRELQDSDFGFVYQVLTFTRRHNETESTFARRFNTYSVAWLRIVLKYGPSYLTPEEYAPVLRTTLKKYYRFLGSSVLRGREQDFWQYHKGEFEKTGLRLSKWKLAAATLAVLLDHLLNPKRSVERLIASYGSKSRR